MKHFKKLFISFFVAFMLVAICPKCAPFKVNAANVKINKKKIILVQKQKAKLKITGTKDSVKWSSKNTYVAKVSKKGIVTAKNEGTARIIAQVGKKKYKCIVKVEKPYIGTDEGGESYIEVGETIRFYMCNTSCTKYTWRSSDTRIATVDKKGIVTGNQPGNTTIYAYVRGCKLKKTIHVTERSIENIVQITPFGDFNFTIKNDGDKIVKVRATGYIYASIRGASMYCHDFDEGSNNYEFITINPGEEKTLHYFGTGYLGRFKHYTIWYYYGDELHSYPR